MSEKKPAAIPCDECGGTMTQRSSTAGQTLYICLDCKYPLYWLDWAADLDTLTNE